MTKERSRLSRGLAATQGYIASHWRGQQSLAWSFWVNLAALGVVIFSLEGVAQRFLPAESQAALLFAVGYFLLFHVVVFIWQVIGVIRACDRYQASYGSITTVWGVYLGVAVSLLLVIVGAFVTFQSALVAPEEYVLAPVWEQERASRYELRLSEDGRRILFRGSIELGLTKKVTALLEGHPELEAIVLSSPGGNIYEARGVAKQAKAFGLDSYVFETCYSACTTVFIAGKTRHLGTDGSLGFHQYAIDADYEVPFVDLQKEQLVERQFFEAQAVNAVFLDRVFSAAHTDLWFPSQQELLEAGVVHRVVE